jgi:adenylate kinase
MRIVLLGKPGSGKGTQASLVSDRFGYFHLSSGEVLREEITKGSSFGKKIERYVLRGEIGPEKLITDTILNFIGRKGIDNRLILDGFPRTAYQAERLDETYPPDLCILLNISDKESIRRLSGRYLCGRCGAPRQPEEKNRSDTACSRCGGEMVQRDDDRPEAIQQRLEIFRREVVPVVSRYRRRDLLTELDGSLPPGEIYNNIRNSIMKLVGPN